MKKIILTSTIVILFLSNFILTGQNSTLPPKSAHNFIYISDHGRNGYYNQLEVADKMMDIASKCNVRFFVTGGDNFQIRGPQSTQDYLWISSFESIYTHPSTLVNWYPALGNHDHAGNIQAQIDYSAISRRWTMPSNYYTVVEQRNDVSIRLVILDTTPIYEAYVKDKTNYLNDDIKRQFEWVDSVLSVAKEDWVVVVGHHPVFSAHPERGNTQALVDQLKPIMEKYNVDFYIGAHDHIFQHLKDPNSKIDYFVNTAGSEVRSESTNEMTVFAGSSPGFSLCSATETDLSIYFINIDGEVIYSYSRQKSNK